MENVVIARAPVCIDLGGGVYQLVNSHHGPEELVISAAVSYYVYAILTSSQLNGVQVTFEGCQAFSGCSAVETPLQENGLGLLEAIARHFDIRDGLRVFVASQLPSGGGLNLHGSLAASMIKVLAFRCGLDLGSLEVAELACSVGNKRDNGTRGRISSYAAALGGLYCITCSPDSVRAEPLGMSAGARRMLEKKLMLFLPTRSAQGADEFYGQNQNLSQQGLQVDQGKRIRQLALNVRAELERGDLEAFGHLLHECWVEENRLGFVDPVITRWYQTALRAGALGGKASDIGNGYSLLLYCPEDRQQRVTEALASLGLQHWPVLLEDEGVQVMQAMPWSWSKAAATVPWSHPLMVQDPALITDPNHRSTRG